MNRVLIAFDQSTTKTGYAIYDINSKGLMDYGLINIPKASPVEERIYLMTARIVLLCQKYENVEVVFEDIVLENQGSKSVSFSKVNNVATYKVLAQLQGAIIFALRNEGRPYTTLAPTVWKSRVGINTGIRSQQKLLSKQLVSERYSKEVSEDEADAINIGAAYLKEM